jgi:hypothetical protein
MQEPYLPTDVCFVLGNPGLLHPANSTGCKTWYGFYHPTERTRVMVPADLGPDTNCEYYSIWLLPVLLSFSFSLSPRRELEATLLHLSFVFGFEFQIQTLSASFLRTAEIPFQNSVCIFFLVPTGCVLHSRCLLLRPDCLSFTLCLHVRSQSTWVRDGLWQSQLYNGRKIVWLILTKNIIVYKNKCAYDHVVDWLRPLGIDFGTVCYNYKST